MSHLIWFRSDTKYGRLICKCIWWQIWSQSGTRYDRTSGIRCAFSLAQDLVGYLGQSAVLVWYTIRLDIWDQRPGFRRMTDTISGFNRLQDLRKHLVPNSVPIWWRSIDSSGVPSWEQTPLDETMPPWH